MPGKVASEISKISACMLLKKKKKCSELIGISEPIAKFTAVKIRF